MKKRIVILGFGGQGVLLLGDIIANAYSKEGKYILKTSSYGAEMRGGTVSCTVIVSDKKINSPLIDEADIVLILDESLEINIPKMSKNGTVIINSDLLKDIQLSNDDLRIFNIPATEIAKNMGNPKIFNMILLGVLIKKAGISKVETINLLLPTFFKSKEEFIKMNSIALKKGWSL